MYEGWCTAIQKIKKHERSDGHNKIKEQNFKRVLWGGAAHGGSHTFHTAVIFRNAFLMSSKCLCTIPLWLPTSPTLQESRFRTKGRWKEEPPSGSPAVSWKVLNKAALLVTKPAGKHELDREQIEALNPFCSCSATPIFICYRCSL